MVEKIEVDLGKQKHLRQLLRLAQVGLEIWEGEKILGGLEGRNLELQSLWNSSINVIHLK